MTLFGNFLHFSWLPKRNPCLSPVNDFDIQQDEAIRNGKPS